MTNMLDRIHHYEYNNLKMIVKICQQYDIPYFLTGGSLLGAIRHQGFIPWDDDIDIGMLRADYDRFAEVAKTALKGTHYFLQTPDTDNDYGLSYMKLLDRNTYIEERNNVNNARKGVFVDIFPYDKIPDDEELRQEQANRLIYLNGLIMWRLHYSFINSPLRRFSSELSDEKLDSVAQLKEERHTLMTQYNHQNFNNVKNIASQYSYEKEIFSMTEATTLTAARFNSIDVNIPVAYDAILTRMYGDYMALPPERQRTEKHLVRLIADNQEFTE